MRQYGEGIQLKYDTPYQDGGSQGPGEETIDANRERLSSESSISKQMRCHRRAESDPFDTAGLDEIGETPVDDYGLVQEQQFALPTLQRFPFAETHNQNCWSEPPANIFQVRGGNYLADKKKVTATKYLLRARGCDLFLSDKPNQIDVGRWADWSVVKISDIALGWALMLDLYFRVEVFTFWPRLLIYIFNSLVGALGGSLRQESSLLIRFTFPWGLLIQYYEIPKHLAGFMRPGENPSTEGLSPGEKALAMWLAGDTDYRNERLKLISYVPEGPWVVRNLVTGKPAIIGKKLPVKYKYTPLQGAKKDFVECELDIGNSSATARRIVSVCRRYMRALSVDIGFVIEGTTAAELPEEMMGAIRIHEVDPVKAPTIS